MTDSRAALAEALPDMSNRNRIAEVQATALAERGVLLVTRADLAVALTNEMDTWECADMTAIELADAIFAALGGSES